jgi:protein-tyrosine phosphatase
MAEAIFKRLIKERNVELSFNVSSFATSDCEEDNPVYPPARRVLAKYGYNFSHTAKQISLRGIKNADYLLVMDEINLRDLTNLVGGNYSEKIFKLGHFLPNKIDIDDPWYTGDFERTYREIYSACTCFLDYLLSEHADAFDYDRRH